MALNFERLDLKRSFLVCRYVFGISRSVRISRSSGQGHWCKEALSVCPVCSYCCVDCISCKLQIRKGFSLFSTCRFRTYSLSFDSDEHHRASFT